MYRQLGCMLNILSVFIRSIKPTSVCALTFAHCVMATPVAMMAYRQFNISNIEEFELLRVDCD